MVNAGSGQIFQSHGAKRGMMDNRHLSHEKQKHATFHYPGWLMRILIMVYYNPYIIGFSTFDLSAR